jgi:osmoprotectant transport system permease protein
MKMNNFAVFFARNKGALINALGIHLRLSFMAVIIGIFIAVPLGIILTRYPKISSKVLGISGIFQTIPSMVMFGIALPLLGIGMRTALIVLIIYSVFPILRNTYTGISEIPEQYILAAKGMGMNTVQSLIQVELPLARPIIISGIQISAVYIISWSTVAALVGAGGLGDLIYTGIQTYNYSMILLGAVPACILAVFTSFAIGFIAKMSTPRGMRT